MIRHPQGPVMTREILVGFDIGGTKCAVILGEAREDKPVLLDRVAFPTDHSGGPGPILAKLETEARRLCAASGGLPAAIGISCGGPLDSERGVILGPPNLPGWDEVPVVAHFARAFGVPAALLNDANACALAEHRWGAGRGCRHMILLTCGTGMGAGVILNGRLYEGACGLAGEVGHVRLAENGPLGYGKPGSFEGFCSGGGIAQAARETGIAGEAVSAQAVAEAARRGDPVASEVMARAASYLGRGLAMLIDILNPERIVIGGIFMRERDLLWPIARAVIDQEALSAAARRCEVLPAALGEAIGDYAALLVADLAVDR
jgi:glucokinase